MSYNDGSYLAFKRNIELRNRKREMNKKPNCKNKTSQYVILNPVNEFEYHSAEDSAIYHERCFEEGDASDHSLKAEVSKEKFGFL